MSVEEQVAMLCDGCDHVEKRDELAARLRAKSRLTVKLGLDPTTADLHLGHAVVLHKLQQFVEFGHAITLIIGDFTARIGDPTGRNDARPPLTEEQIRANMTTYAEQAGRVLDLERITVRYNSEWLAPLAMADLLRLLSQVTVAQMLARSDFAARFERGTAISLHEFLYPVAQAYDSVALAADVELGGTDQLFNLLVGRAYQHHAGQPSQICMTVPLLEGLDGEKKMSKSTGNYVGISEPPAEQFGKLMSLPDAAIVRYAQYAAFYGPGERARLERSLGDGSLHPMDAKKEVAGAIVARYHGADAAMKARESFERTVQRGELPAEMPELVIAGRERVGDVLVRSGMAASKREAERLVLGGGVRIDGNPCVDTKSVIEVPPPRILQVGSRRFCRLVAAS